MKNTKNNKIILAVIPATILLAAGVSFFCSRSSNSDKLCQEAVTRLEQLEAADISDTESQLRLLAEKDSRHLLPPLKREFWVTSSQMYRLNRCFRALLL